MKHSGNSNEACAHDTVLVLDLGNVVIGLSSENIFRALSHSSGIQLHGSWETYFDDAVSRRFECGMITPEEYSPHIQKQLNIKISDREFYAAFNSLFTGVFPGLTERLRILKKKHRILVLSNTNAIHQSFFVREYAQVFSLFDRCYYSHEMKMRKPDAGIYQAVLAHENLSPGSICYLDDNPLNIAAGEKTGMRSVLITGMDGTIRALDACFPDELCKLNDPNT